MRRYIHLILDELRSHGIDDVEVDRRRNKPQVTFSHLGIRRSISIPNSPSDSRRGEKNAVAYVRRLIREIEQTNSGTAQSRGNPTVGKLTAPCHATN